eukprot:759696-Hanusia_phi.AAC.2
MAVRTGAPSLVSLSLSSLLLLLLLSSSIAAPAPKTCSTGVEEEAGDQPVDGAHNARLGFEFMKHASQDPTLMADAMKDMQDPDTMHKVQEMMQDPNFRERKLRDLVGSGLTRWQVPRLRG